MTTEPGVCLRSPQNAGIMPRDPLACSSPAQYSQAGFAQAARFGAEVADGALPRTIESRFVLPGAPRSARFHRLRRTPPAGRAIRDAWQPPVIRALLCRKAARALCPRSFPNCARFRLCVSKYCFKSLRVALCAASLNPSSPSLHVSISRSTVAIQSVCAIVPPERRASAVASAMLKEWEEVSCMLTLCGSAGPMVLEALPCFFRPVHSPTASDGDLLQIRIRIDCEWPA